MANNYEYESMRPINNYVVNGEQGVPVIIQKKSKWQQWYCVIFSIDLLLSYKSQVRYLEFENIPNRTRQIAGILRAPLTILTNPVMVVG